MRENYARYASNVGIMLFMLLAEILCYCVPHRNAMLFMLPGWECVKNHASTIGTSVEHDHDPHRNWYFVGAQYSRCGDIDGEFLVRFVRTPATNI